MGFEVKKVDYVTGTAKEPTFVEVQTEIGKVKVEQNIFKSLISGKNEDDMPLGVELKNGIKVRNLNHIYTPNGEITIYDMPIANSKPHSNVCIYANGSTVFVDSANNEHNCVEIRAKNATVHARRDQDDSVDFYSENENFSVTPKYTSD